MKIRLLLAITGVWIGAPLLSAQQPAPEPPHAVRIETQEHDMPHIFPTDREGPGWHGHHGFDIGKREWWKNPKLAERLGLTPEQTKKLDTLSLEGEIQLIHLRAALEENEVRLRAVMDDPTVDLKKAEVVIDKTADSRAEVEKAEIRFALSLRGVLTVDQWTKLHEPVKPDVRRMPNFPGAPEYQQGPPQHGTPPA